MNTFGFHPEGRGPGFRRTWAFAFAVFALSWLPAQEEGEVMPTGAAPLHRKDFAKIGKVAPLAGSAVGEPVISMRERFPHPRHQGRLSSCVTFAACYAIKTYLERSRNGWEDTDNTDEHVFSPAFIYNEFERQISKGPLTNSKGIKIQAGLSFLEGAGCCTWKTMPYDGETAGLAEDHMWDEARRYRRDKWDTIDIRNVGLLRQYLAAGKPVIFGAVVDTAGGRWAVDEKGITDRLLNVVTGYHAMVLVGYDDNKGGPGMGAFEVMNSWGDQWNDGGFAWVAYTFWPQWVNEGYVIWDSREEAKQLPLPDNVKASDLRWLPPGPEGKRNGNWGYPDTVILKDLKVTEEKKYPEQIRSFQVGE